MSNPGLPVRVVEKSHTHPPKKIEQDIPGRHKIR